MESTKKMEKLIGIAMCEAEDAILRGDEPYGAVISDAQGNVIASDGNRENSFCDPCAHAEMLVIRKACITLKTKDLSGYHIYTNYKPCPMCSAAILMTGVKHVYVGSEFQGFSKLFEETAQKIKDSEELILTTAVKAEECKEQVYRGREQLQKNNPEYKSGHKNGMI